MLNHILRRSVGIDISDRSIEVVSLSALGRPHVRSMGRAHFEEGVVENGRVKNEEKCIETIRAVYKSARPRSIRMHRATFAIPESQVYTHIWQFDPTKSVFINLPESEKMLAVFDEIRKSVPIESNDIAFGYHLLAPGAVLIVATQREVLLEWERVFKKAGIIIEAFDTESFGLVRNLFATLPEKPVCVVDMGARVTHILVVGSSGMVFSHTIPVAGDSFTSEVGSALQMNKEEAEDRKIKLGLVEGADKNLFILIKALQPIETAIREVGDYFARTFGTGINEIILTGGSSRLAGLSDYLSTNLGLPVRLGAPVITMPADSFEFLEAAGIALRAFNRRDPALHTDKIQRGEAARFSKRTIVMGVVGIVLLFVVAFAIRYATRRAPTTQPSLPDNTTDTTIVPSYSKQQTIVVTVPIEINPAEYDGDHVSARIVEKTVDSGTDYKEVVVHSAIDMEQELKSGERVWSTPLNQLSKTAPFVIDWLVYSHDDVERIALTQLKQMNSSVIPYRLNSLTETALHTVSDNKTDTFEVSINLSLDRLIEVPHDTTPSKESVVVQTTETGWLNVRSAPASSGALIRKILPGERYTLIGEDGDWYHIDLGDGKDGWASKQYLKKAN